MLSRGFMDYLTNLFTSCGCQDDGKNSEAEGKKADKCSLFV